jgi:hypothetical protein
MALDMSVTAPPPKKVEKAPVAKKDTSHHAARKEGLSEFFGALSMATVIVGWKADAGALAIYGAHASEEIATVADEYEQVGDAVDYLARGSIWVGLAAALLPLGMQLAVNHNLIKEKHVTNAGIHSPAELESIIDTQLAEREAQMLREKIAAQRRLASLKAEINSYVDEVASE